MNNWFESLQSFNPAATLFANTLSLVINQALQLSPHSLAQLDELSGKSIAIELQGMMMNFVVLPDVTGLKILANDTRECDVTISAPPFTLMRLTLQEEVNLNSEEDVIINGKIGIAQHLFNVLRNLDIDWEEHVARVLGDIPAHQFGQWLRQVKTYNQERAETFQANLSEYLQEEARYFPVPDEMADFVEQVDTTRDDVERLALRIQRLEA